MTRKLAPQKSAKPKKLPPLTDVQQLVMTYLINNVAFDNYGDCCSVEDVAKEAKRTPGRFMPTLQKLVDKGYITIEGKTFPWIYPTVAALMHQDPTLTDAAAKKILKKIRR